MLASRRICLRAIERSDLAMIARWRSAPEAYDWFYEYLPISEEQQRLWYEKQLNNPTEMNWVVADTANTPIGTVSLYRIDLRNRKADWGRLVIGDAAWRGQGIGKEVEALVAEYAFEHLNLHKLCCEVLADNITALALHHKFGFNQEGLLKAHIFKRGGWQDVVLLALSEEEYRRQRQSGYVRDCLAAAQA